WGSTGGTVPGDDLRRGPDQWRHHAERAQDCSKDWTASTDSDWPEARRVARAGNRGPSIRADFPVTGREGVERPESQQDVFPAPEPGRTAAGSGAVPRPTRVWHEDLPREGNRVRPSAAGAPEHLDHPEVHAPRRSGVGRRARFGGLNGYA